MSTGKSVFFLGGTGYIGSAVLSKLLERKDLSTFTVLTRSQEKFASFEGLNDPRVKPVRGDLRDLDLLEKLADEHDIVVNTADADALPTTESLLKGMRTRKDRTGIVTLLIHTSGTGVLSDEALGMHGTDVIYSDRAADTNANPPLVYVDSVNDNALHRDVDLTIVKADEKGDVKSYIIFPSTIYGLNRSTIAERGIGNIHSIQMPALIKASLARRRAGTVGDGLNIWPNVHISDVSDLFSNVLDLALGDDHGNHGRNGYFFAETGEHSLKSVAIAIGKIMLDLSFADSVEPTTFTQPELDEYFGGSSYLGSNARARAEKSREIGWKPVHGPADFYASFEEEVKAIVATAGSDLKKLQHNRVYSPLAAVRPA